MDVANKAIEPAVEFMNSLELGERIAIVHGHDCDAVTSAAVLYLTAYKLTGIRPQLVASESNSEVSLDVINKVKDFEKIIVPDIPVIPQKVLKNLHGKKILVIDHHPPVKYRNVTYSNPRLIDKNAYIPVSYLSYRIYRELFGSAEIDWISAVGTLGDHAATNCADLFKNLRDKKDLVGNLNIVDEELYKKSLLGKMTRMVNSAQVVNGKNGASYAVSAFISSRSYHDLLKNPSLISWEKDFENEFGKISKDFKENKSVRGRFISYEIVSRLKLNSSLSGYLAQFFPQKIIVIYQKEGDICNVSLRRGKEVHEDLSVIAKKLIRGIPKSSSGGHPAASGIKFPSNQMKTFFRNFEKISQ